MQRRSILEETKEGNQTFMKNQSNYNPNYWTISNSFFPVDSALAMRDNNSNLQVTIMNEKAQGGTADLTDKATIEFMQNRRLLFDDHLGLEEPLNETDNAGWGLRINSLYHMQIFDRQKASSLQRFKQLQLQNRPQYFFGFDYNASVASLSQQEKDQNQTQMLTQN